MAFFHRPLGDVAPPDAGYLVTVADDDLSNEVVVGATPGGELGGTWAAPTVDATHSGSAHHAEDHAARHAAAGADPLSHDSIAGVSANDHHNQAHAIDGADHSGSLGHAALSGVTGDQHHAQLHAAAHAENAADELLVEGLGTAGGSNTVPKSDGAGGLAMGQVAHGELSGAGANDHHAQLHAAAHAENAADEVLVEDLGTATLVAERYPRSDGAGGLAMAQVDHGGLAGLADDDHPQYATNTEFDDHNARHEPGGADPMAVDAAAATGSLRSLGTGAQQAAAGNHTHAAGGNIATGSYTGDGATSQAITGVGFQVKAVLITERRTTATSFNTKEVIFTTDVIIDDNASGLAIDFEDGGLVASKVDAIIALGSDGFTVDDAGADAAPNTTGVVYNFIAWG